MRIGVIIPALNEEKNVGEIVRRCLEHCPDGHLMRVAVCDNGSTDHTAQVAREAGAEVAHETRRGYGAACLRAIAHLADWPEIYLFLDADGSSAPEEMRRLLEPIERGRADLTLGRRQPDPHSMTPPQRFGTCLAAALIRLRWRVYYHDLGPFRAITRAAYQRLQMQDQTWGWTVEMQIRAIQEGLHVQEVFVSWHNRLSGRSKISGTVMGVLRAGTKILITIARHAGGP